MWSIYTIDLNTINTYFILLDSLILSNSLSGNSYSDYKNVVIILIII